ncbi:MAG: ATP-binding protein [Ignavibacteria bacterium]|nr:ATP-binding protein [Ignavibacteria bacterium]
MSINPIIFQNPYKPGAGHMPPYLAGRENEIFEFQKIIEQKTILENLIITGLRGVGKTVLLETLKPKAQISNWLWLGTDLSETVGLKEENLVRRLITDISIFTSNIKLESEIVKQFGFTESKEKIISSMNYIFLESVYEKTDGLTSDKLKAVLKIVWKYCDQMNIKGIVFAYDEAQNLYDNSKDGQYALSLLLDVFQSIQRQGIPFLLLLTGLPTLFPKLVDARTYAERMFHQLFLERLNEVESKKAILKPIEQSENNVMFNDKAVAEIIKLSGGYPYFIQFICKEAFDIFLQSVNTGSDPVVPVKSIIRKLDTDFFSGRWARATDKQRELLILISQLKNCDSEFSVIEIEEQSKSVSLKPFSKSSVNQLLSSLINIGLVYKNRFGKYSLAVPLLHQFIKRQLQDQESSDV